MKKIFTLLALVCCSLSVLAEDYKCNLAVWVNNIAADPQQMNISATKQGDGKYTLELKNFILYSEGAPMPVGNITVNDIDATSENGVDAISTKQGITITAGNVEGLAETDWLGPILCMAAGGTINITLNGSISSNGILTAELGIPFDEDMDIKVMIKSSNAFQIPNSDFEGWHTATYKDQTSDEPNAWHSFMSCTGTLAGFVSGTPHTFIADDVRPGATGSKSVRVESALVYGQSANGTITTGRLQAGSLSATDAKNCSFLDLSKTDKDANGDPFYAVLDGHPDAIKLWVKYLPGTNDDLKATVSAVVTDGTYYQDPEDKTYTNVVAKAQNKEIAKNGGEWQEIVVPFTYTDAQIAPKAVLVTVSTCATPGGGSKDSAKPDVLYVDDFSLVYNSKLTDVKFFGQSVEGFGGEQNNYNVTLGAMPTEADITYTGAGKGTFAIASISGKTVTLTSMSEDYMEKNVYEFNVTVDPTLNITNVNNANNSKVVNVYNINGQQVNNTDNAGVYIIRTADGATKKVIKK